VATVLELAAHAEVSAENVLRVIHGESVSQDVEDRVRRAIEELGAPRPPRRAEVLPALAEGPRKGGHDTLVERFRAATAELEASLPEGVGTVVYEALRVEVRPVAQHVAELGALFERMLARLEDVSAGVQDERRDRLDDVALLTELVTNGWRSVDRRLARLEQVVARVEAGRNSRREARIYRLDDAAGGQAD
jgi:DNA-binding transcriptional ArsR family regulator